MEGDGINGRLRGNLIVAALQGEEIRQLRKARVAQVVGELVPGAQHPVCQKL